MLKWTSKGSLNSEEVANKQMPHNLSWHKPRDIGARRHDPMRLPMAEKAEQQRLQAFLSAEPGAFDGLRGKRTLASEPNSPHCSREDLRHFRSLSLPSSPLVKKKRRYGVFKRLKNIFRKGKGERIDNLGSVYVTVPNPGFYDRGNAFKEDKKGAIGRKAAPKTRLTRLIEARRGQRKASLPEDNRYSLGESPSFLTPSTSSDEEGYATFFRNDVSDGHLGSFTARNLLHTFPAGDDKTSKAIRSLDRSVKYGSRPVETSNMEMPQMVEEPKVIARFVRGFDNEIDVRPFGLNCYNSESKHVDEIPPIKAESFILDGSRYELINSPVQSSQLSSLDKYIGQSGANGIRKLRQRNFEGHEDDSRSSMPCVSSVTVQELTRSLSLIRESGSLERVKVMFSSTESIVQARSLLCPPTSEHQSPRSKFTSSPNSIRVDTIALHSDQWLSQGEEQTLLYPSQSSSMNDFFYKAVEDTHEEYNHQNPLCTRNNNNGHHNSPLVSTTTLYDLPPDVSESFFKPSYVLKPEKNVDAFTSTRNEIDFSDGSFVSSPPFSPYCEKSRGSGAGRIDDDCRSDSDTKYSSLDTNHLSLLSIQPKRVKDIVDQIERESLNSLPRFSPTEKATERRLKDVESIRQTGNNNKASHDETAQALTQETMCASIKECVPYNNVGSTDVERAADREEKSSGDNYSFALDDDTYSRSDLAEQDLTSPGSSSFHMSEQVADDQNTYASDTNAFYSDNSDALTSSSFSKDGEDPERATKFAPVVHLVCNSLMNSVSFDTKSEQDFQEGQLSERVQSCGDCVQSQNAENQIPLSPTVKSSICNIDEPERNHCCTQELKSIERELSDTGDDIIKLLPELLPERKDVREHEEEPNLALCEFQNIEIVNYMVSVQERDDGADIDTETGFEEEGITDVIAPKLMTVLDSSLQDNVSETLENKSVMSEANTSLCSNNNFEQRGNENGKQDNINPTESVALKEKTVVSPVVNGSIFYMPECALEEFHLAAIACSNVNEIKSKKKVSFKLDINSTEESSVSDDRAVLEITLPQRRKSGSFFGQSSESEVIESASSTDVSITDLSNKQSELIGGLTPPVTSTSGDDFSWWGTENIEDIDFFHDESFSIDEGQPQPQDTNVAPSSATENLLQEGLSSVDFGLPENFIEEDVCATSNILTLSSFLTSGSIFNMNADDREALFLTEIKEQDKGPEMANDVSQATFDEKSLLQCDAYQWDRSVNKQNEQAGLRCEEYADETLRDEMDHGPTEDLSDQEPEEESIEDDIDVDQASDINTHTYNVIKDGITEENKRQAWWESHSAASASNFSFGSFEIDSQDESNTLSELYNQLKSPKHSLKASNKKQMLVQTPTNRGKDRTEQKSPEDLSPLLKSNANIRFKKDIDSTESEQQLTNSDYRSSRSTCEDLVTRENNEDKLLKSGKVSVSKESSYLDKNYAHGDVLSAQSQSTGTMRLDVSRGISQLRTNISDESGSSCLTYSDQSIASPRSIPNQTIEDDDDNAVSPMVSERLWEMLSSASASVASDGPNISDDDGQVELYSRHSPCCTDNVKEYTGSADSCSETTHDSVSSSSQCLTDSCVRDDIANYVPVSRQNISETNFERTGSTVTGYTEVNSRNAMPPMYHNRSVNATLKLVQTMRNVTETYRQPTVTNSDAYYCLNKRMDQKAVYNLIPQKEVEINTSTPSSSYECSWGFECSRDSRSGKSLTLAVADSDTTATTDLLSLDVFNVPQSRPIGNGKGVKGKIVLENSDLSAGGGQRTRVSQLLQSAVAPVKQSTSGRYQQPGYYSYNDQDGQGQQQQPSREQRLDGQHQRSRFTSKCEGGATSRPYNEQSSPGSSCHACTNWKKTDSRAQKRPVEWLFIASFFVFQLFMHWVYA